MEKQRLTSALYFRTLSLMHAALVLGPLVFAGVSLYSRWSGTMPTTDAVGAGTYLYVVIAVAVTGVVGSQLVFTRLLASAMVKPTLPEKLRGFQAASVVRFALLESPALMGLAVFYTTGGYLFLAVSIVPLLLLLVVAPRKQQVIDSLQLSDQEASVVNDPDSIIGEFVVGDD
ncbi:MAG: hypothetical protein IPP90_10845 [Gemmatimonadaceae bacterium]|nr:hypothetical protein [Gemmatimonadaceae bacterium]